MLHKYYFEAELIFRLEQGFCLELEWASGACRDCMRRYQGAGDRRIKKRHRLADSKFGVSLEGTQKVMEGDDVTPLVAEHDILWRWLSDKKLFSYDIKRETILRRVSMAEGYHIGKTMCIGRASLANLRGMQR